MEDDGSEEDETQYSIGYYNAEEEELNEAAEVYSNEQEIVAGEEDT